MYCLIVDDSEVNRMLSKQIVESMGLTAQVASNAEEGIALCNRMMPRVIILDWIMPGTDGLGFMRLLRKLEGGHRPMVIMCTGVKDMEKVRKALEEGVKGYITKPFKKEDFVKQFKHLKII